MSNLENLFSLTQSEHFRADQAKFFNFVIHILYVAYNAPDKIRGNIMTLSENLGLCSI